MKRLPIALVAILILAFAVSSASAQVALFDQSSFDELAPGFFNSESGSPPFGMTNHAVNHVTAPGAWNIQKITTYYSALDQDWGLGIFEGYVHIWPKSGPLPLATDDPTASMVVPMTAVLVGTHFEVSTVGLDININAGVVQLQSGRGCLAPHRGFGAGAQRDEVDGIGEVQFCQLAPDKTCRRSPGTSKVPGEARAAPSARRVLCQSGTNERNRQP